MYTYKEWGCLISIVLLLGMVGNALAADVEWTNEGVSNRLWSNADNWSGGVPGSADKACIRNSGVGPLIDSGTTAVVLQVVLSDWSSSGDYVDMTGGSLATSDWFVIGYQPVNNGTFNLSAGTVSVGADFLVGNMGAGTLNMTGGSITVTGLFGIAQVSGGAGDVFLDGGTISCGSFDMASSAAAMDITGGTLIVNGDATSTINGYISSGWLTAYGGSGVLQVDYNVSNPGKTTVIATTPEKASYPSPANGATGVSINADLSWTAGIYADSHDVYFGTDSTPDATEFQGNQTETTFEPGTLELATTYYWRIDEINLSDPNSPWVGDVWSFTTQTSTATLEKGPYLIYTGDNTEMQVLWQLDYTETCSLEWGLDTNYSDGNVNVSEYGTDHQYKYTIGSVTPLTPGAKYYYKVTVGTGTSTGTFMAAPASSATNVKFLMYGDTRTNAADHATVCAGINAAIASDPDYQTMLLLAGDWVNTNSENNWTNEYFNRSYPAPMLTQASVPIMGTMGNHEGGGSVYLKYWPYPYVAAKYWSFDYGPVHVAVVDQYTTYTSGSTQHNWLVNDLSNSTKQWKIINLHQPGWSCRGGHNNDTTVQNVIQPLCELYDVQIVLGGHNHYYSRALVNGVHHITSGGGGAPLYNPADGEPYIVSYLKTLNFQKVEIVGDTMNYQSLQPDGTVIDTFQINNAPCFESTSHVQSIVCETARGSQGKKYGQVTVTIYDDCGDPVGNADVTGTFTGDYNEQLTETTNGSGVAVITTTTQIKSPTAYTFCVDSVTHATLTYDDNDNLETCDYYGTPPSEDPPGQASNPSPADSATGVSVDADLSWTAGDYADSHDVYFGTNPTPGAGEFIRNQTETTYDPGTMAESTTYYWRIDEKNNYGTTTGVVWSFTTGAGCSASTTHVESIVCGTAAGSQGKKYGQVTVTIYDDCGDPVGSADVTGTFTGDFSEQLTETTNGSGVAVITTTTQVKRPSYMFCVDSVTHATLTYDPNDNVETCDSN